MPLRFATVLVGAGGYICYIAICVTFKCKDAKFILHCKAVWQLFYKKEGALILFRVPLFH